MCDVAAIPFVRPDRGNEADARSRFGVASSKPIRWTCSRRKPWKGKHRSRSEGLRETGYSPAVRGRGQVSSPVATGRDGSAHHSDQEPG